MQLFDVDLFSSAGVQEMPANVVRGPEKTLAEKIAGAVDAVKRVVRAGKQPVVAWSGGKDSSVTLNIAFTAIRELATEGFAVPTLNVMHSDTLIGDPLLQPEPDAANAGLREGCRHRVEGVGSEAGPEQ